MKTTATSLGIAAIISLGLVVPCFLVRLAYQCDDINDIE